MATVRIQLRRGTAAQWTSSNPILAAGEMGVETDTRKVKIGDGTTSWTSLDYVAADSPEISEIAQDAVNDALVAGTGITKSYDDNANTITVSVDTSVIATKAELAEVSQDSVNDAIVAGVGLDKVYDDNANTITLDIDSTVATLTGTQTLTNKTLTSPSITTPTGIVKADVGLSNVDNTSDANKPVSTPQASAIAAAKSQAKTDSNAYTDDQINLVLGAAPEALNTLDELAAALNDDANFASTVTNSLSLKAPLASPVFTGTVSLPASTDIGEVSSTEIAYLNGVTSGIQGQIDSKLATATASSTYAPLASPTFTGTVTLPGSTTIGEVSNLELGYLNGVTSGIQGQIDSKLATATASSTYAPLASPTFTGTVTLPGSTTIGDVSNLELGYLNGVTSEIQGQLDSKAPLASPTFTGTVILPINTVTGAMIADLTIPTGKIADTAITAVKLASSAVETIKINNAAVTTDKINDGAVTSAKIADGTIVNADINSLAAIDWTKLAISSTVSDTELGYVDGVTSAIQTQIDSKAPLAFPTFTGTVSGITATMVGLGNVNNTSDANKPVSTATQTALDLKANLASPTFTGTVILPSTTSVGTVSNVEIGYLDGVTSAIQTQIDAKAASADVSAHTSATTSVHGISDTAQLAYKNAANQTFTGNLEVDGNMTVDGNFTVNGTTISASATTIVIADNLVQLAHENAANTVDLGLIVAYNDGTAKHAGIVRDVSANKWKLFEGVTDEPSTTVNFSQGTLDDLEVADITASSATIGDVSNTELQYLNGVTSAIQTQIDSKAPLASPTFTGTVSGITATMVGLGNVNNTSDANKPVSTATQTALDLKANLSSPTFTGTVTLSASGVEFTDGTQTKQGVPSLTIIETEISAAYNLSTGGLALRDRLIPIAGAQPITVPTNATLAWPIGGSVDFYQASGTGANFVEATGVTILRTPGLTLRTTHSSATLTKVATNTWLLAGDLTA